MARMLFVGGVHGVGKTYLCNIISDKYNLVAYSASELISKMRKKEFNKNKKIENINQNQYILTKAINNIVTENNSFILDGHFCLLDKQGRITRVPEKTFYNLCPKVIIVLIESIEKIVDRLNCRDKIKYDKKLIENFQKQELEYSSEISQKLQVPYLIYSNSEKIDRVFNFIENVFINN